MLLLYKKKVIMYVKIQFKRVWCLRNEQYKIVFYCFCTFEREYYLACLYYFPYLSYPVRPIKNNQYCTFSLYVQILHNLSAPLYEASLHTV